MIFLSSTFGLLFILLAVVDQTSASFAFQQGSQAQSWSRYYTLNTAERYNAYANACPDIAASSKLQLPEIDIEDDHVRKSVSVSDSLRHALAIIKNVESLPSCTKIASSALMHSCSALEGSIEHEEASYSRGSDLLVDEEADIYAARLAVCELHGAEYSLPKDCQAFVPTNRATRKREIRGWWTKDGPTKATTLFQYYDDISQSNLKQCRSALLSDPRSWTSFSNSRQNAVVMCRAMRSEVEKDEQLHVGKILADTAAAAAESLQDAINRSKIIETTFHQITTAMPRFQQDLAEGNEQQVEWVRNFWTGLERVQDGLQDVIDGVSGVQDQVSHANDDVKDLRAGIANAANESALQVKNALSGPLTDISEMSEDVAAVAQLVDFTHERLMQGVIKLLYNITQDISIINGFMPQLEKHLVTTRDSHLRMHEESARSHEQIQHYANRTRESLEQLQEHLHGFVKVITDVVEHGWTGVLSHLWSIVFTFSCFLISFLFSFATCGHLLGLSLLNNVAASFGCGVLICTASLFLRTLSIPSITTHKLYLSIDTTTLQYLSIGAACMGATAVTYLWVRALTRGRKPYDPASPHFQKWAV